MTRFDKRNKRSFEKDIKFGTMIEQFWMRKCLPEIINANIYKDFICVKDNGVDNTGKFTDKPNSSADFLIITKTDFFPLEIKWAPTKGKITLKKDNLISYVKQNADILLIYNNSNKQLKKPKHCDYAEHWRLIEDYMCDILWCIIPNSSIKEILKLKEQKIYYMGNKPGFIIKEQDFGKYFSLRNFINES